MVAYSFQPIFAPVIVSGEKGQTIRAPRKRHARAGEALQLYSGMRTRHCVKIVPDKICKHIDEVHVWPRRAAMLTVNGVEIEPFTEAADRYAIFDGFGAPEMIDKLRDEGALLVPPEFARKPFGLMVRWWYLTHGTRPFDGLAIIWGDDGRAE